MRLHWQMKKESINEVIVKYLMQKENSTESTEEEREKVQKTKSFFEVVLKWSKFLKTSVK